MITSELCLDNIMTRNKLIVNEDGLNYIYFLSKGILSDLFPFYVPDDKILSYNGNPVYELLFLPVTEKQFKKNKSSLIGYKFLVSPNNINSVELIRSPNDNIVSMNIHYEIKRVLYSSDRRNTIHIERNFDPVFPTQAITIQCEGIDIDNTILGGVLNVGSKLAEFYLNKEI